MTRWKVGAQLERESRLRLTACLRCQRARGRRWALGAGWQALVLFQTSALCLAPDASSHPTRLLFGCIDKIWPPSDHCRASRETHCDQELDLHAEIIRDLAAQMT